MYIYKRGVIHGRFQLLHNDHLKYILAGKRLAKHLFIGITNPDPNYTKTDEADPHRSAPDSNPFTYYERYEMVKEALLHEGLSPRDFSIVPLPINFPALYHYYCPKDAVYFLTIYDEWGMKKLRTFKELGLKTYVLWKRPKEKKGLSATMVRQLLEEGTGWEQLVPPPVRDVVMRFHLRERLLQKSCG